MSETGIAIPEAQSAKFFFKRQWLHALALLVLTSVSYAFAAPALGDGSWLGVADTTWYWVAISLAAVHQLAAWIVFRAQLGWALLSRLVGKADLAVWGILFIPLLVARPLLLLGLALSDQGSIDLPRLVQVVLAVALLLPAIYALWSVERCFGLERALGGDHFRLKYRKMPLVRQGAFRWSGNAMYAFAFLGLWSIAFLTGSLAALSLALFQHAFVWAHYYCTEEPDMKLVYGPSRGQPQSDGGSMAQKADHGQAAFG